MAKMTRAILDADGDTLVAAGDLIRHKAGAFDASVEPEARTAKFCISTADVDRDNDVVDQSGWDLSNFLRSPVVLWAHSHDDLPIGKCVAIGVEAGRLMATVEFATHAFAETVWQLVKGGFLKATSVGFRALEYVRNEPRQGLDFKRQELMEFSICPVPANPHALITASAAGVDLAPLKSWLEATEAAWPGGWTTKGSALASVRRKVGDVELETRVGPDAILRIGEIEAAVDRVLGKAATLDQRLATLAKGGATLKVDAACADVAEPVTKVLARPFGIGPAMFSAGGNERYAFTGEGGEPIRWNKSLPAIFDRVSKVFDVEQADFPPQSVEQDLASKYIGAKLSLLDHGVRRIRSTRMPAFLSALDEALRKDDVHVESLRNIDGSGHEAPPQYTKVRYNSKEEHEHLIDGMRFLRWNNERMCIRVEPYWYGLQLSYYATRRDEGSGAAAFMDAVQERAKALNFLRGEAFALSGEFLERKGEGPDDLILSEKNGAIVRRVVALVDEKGAAMEPRGMLMLGPPGTGKTLTGRILMNGTKSTFIWVSSRDMAYFGASGAIEEAFDVARECAPSVLFFEDVDNWIDRATVTDLLKTELDGIKQNTGILTILTTNYPERLPKALIDRPGRFHDVLRFDLPDDAQRKAMIERWLPGLSAEAVAGAVTATTGMSGAHVRELARFATIIADQDKIAAQDALAQALEKLQEQRDLITAVQSSGSHYRAPAAIAEKVAHAAADVAVQIDAHGAIVSGPEAPAELASKVGDALMAAIRKGGIEKRGRVLSGANESRLKAAMAHLVACAESAGHAHGTVGEVLAALPQAPMVEDPEPADDEDDPDEEADGKSVALVLRDELDVTTLSLELRDDDEPFVDLVDAEPVDDATTEIDAAELSAALREMVAASMGQVSEMVRFETTRALNQMRGRVD